MRHLLTVPWECKLIMNETLIDLADILLREEDFQRAFSFLNFYNTTYRNKHSREERIFLTSCCSLVFCRLLSEELEGMEGRLTQAYTNSIQEALECWRDDEVDNFEVSMTSALALLRVWLERFHEGATDRGKSAIKVVTANLCLLVSNPSVTLLKRACSQQSLIVPHLEDVEEVVLGPHGKTINYLLTLGCPLALPDDWEEPLPNSVVRFLYDNAQNLSDWERRDAMECLNVLEEHGFQADWEPIQHMRGILENTNP